MGEVQNICNKTDQVCLKHTKKLRVITNKLTKSRLPTCIFLIRSLTFFTHFLFKKIKHRSLTLI